MAESKNGVPSLVIISQSLYGQEHATKHITEAVSPDKWYKEFLHGASFVSRLTKRNLLPKRRIQVNFTLPSADRNLFEYQQNSSQEVLEIHVGMKDLHYFMPSEIAQLFNNYYKSYQHKQITTKRGLKARKTKQVELL